ncbi:MAG: NUDIX hydrolase [Gammaproteobacteria bacterium]|nr:NUDIX hydrolase [Gammaproteobacteria bacterium]
MSQKPHLTVAAVVEQAGRFLMVEEAADGRVVYNQPAGHLDEGETLVQGVARETLEETAWHFEPESIIGIYRWNSPVNGVTYVRVCFSGRCHGHELGRALDSGILRALWLTRDEVRALGHQLRSPMVLRCIDDYLAGMVYPLSLITELA